MSEELTPVAENDEVKNEKQEAKKQKGAAAKAFFQKNGKFFCWIPVAIGFMLGLVLFLAPLAHILPKGTDLRITGTKIVINEPTGYKMFNYMADLDGGYYMPVLIAIIVGGLSVVFSVISCIISRFRNSIFCDMVASILVVVTLILGAVQTVWLNAESQAGLFSKLCLIFGVVFTVYAVAELVIHWVLIATSTDKIFWKARLNRYKAWLYLAPTIILLLVFTVWPIVNTVRMAFLKDYSGMGAAGGKTFEFGFDNFKNVVGFKRFKNCLGTTMLLTVITVPVSTMLALLIAVALNSIKWIRKTMQTIFFLPYVTNAIAIGMVFNAMFTMILGKGSINNPDSVGIVNSLIQAFGGKPINWVNEGSNYAANIAVVSLYIIWNALPFKILILLGGLQSVNKQYYDAAKVDGTSRTRTFWRITVPLLSPMIAYVVITGFIGGFKEYSSIVGIFGDKMGPIGHEVDTMVGYIYMSIRESNQGRASAAALILFAIIFAVTMVNLYVSKKRVHY